MIPFRAALMQAIANVLKQITIANGFHFDLNDTTDSDGNTISRVRIGETVVAYDAPCPLITINESLENDDPDILDDATGVVGIHVLRVFIQGDVEPANDGFPTLPAYQLMSDVRQRLSAEMLRTSPTDGDAYDPFGMGPTSKLSPTGNCLQKILMSGGIVRGAELAAKDGISPKAHFWMRLGLQTCENSANPYSLT